MDQSGSWISDFFVLPGLGVALTGFCIMVLVTMTISHEIPYLWTVLGMVVGLAAAMFLASEVQFPLWFAAMLAWSWHVLGAVVGGIVFGLLWLGLRREGVTG